MLSYKCKHDLVTQECRDYNARQAIPLECSFRARYLIDGVPYCSKHAGMEALLIGSDRIQELPSIARK